MLRMQRKLSTDSVRAWKNLRRIMSKHQKDMSYAEWVAFAKTQKLNSNKYDPSYNLSVAGQQFNRQNYQRLSAMRFGIFNCDHTLPLPQPVEVFAICNVDGQQNKSMSAIYLIDQNKNMTITYNAADQNSTIPIAFGRTHDYAIVAVGWDGSVAVGDPDAFRARKSLDGSTCSFEMNLVSDQAMSAQELRELILKSK